MNTKLKICENEKCGEVMGGFPRTKCQFCGSKDFSTHNDFPDIGEDLPF